MTAGPVVSLSPTPRARANGWWGMLLVIATEATLFAVLIASYFYIRFKSPVWPPDAIPEPKLFRPLLNNGFLLASAAPLFVADRAIRRGRRSVLRLGLAAAFLLGLAYFFLQLDSFVASWKTSRPEDGTYTSLVYTIVGAHWIHVGAGILLLAWVQARAWLGAFSAERHVGVQVSALYWYFVAVLSVPVVLTTLSPAL
jgi:heme/copper-type cytochrome/quinol oxidase subunit 3